MNNERLKFPLPNPISWETRYAKCVNLRHLVVSITDMVHRDTMYIRDTLTHKPIHIDAFLWVDVSQDYIFEQEIVHEGLEISRRKSFVWLSDFPSIESYISDILFLVCFSFYVFLNML